MDAQMRAAACSPPWFSMSDLSQFDPVALREGGRRCAAECGRGRSAGFTYIGLLMLIAMMGFALTVVAQVWQTAQMRDKEEELLFVGNEIRRAIGTYFANMSRYPHNLEDLLKDPGFPGVRRYLRKIYRDPITGVAEWGLVKPDGNTIVGVYSLSDAEPVKQSGFILADQSFEAKKKYSEWVFLSNGAQGARTASITPVPAAAQTFGTLTAPAAAQDSGALTAPAAVQGSDALTAPPAAQGSAGAATPLDSGTTPLDAGQQEPSRLGSRVRR
jgi:type II secretory pathway pseudopilin PulG